MTEENSVMVEHARFLFVRRLVIGMCGLCMAGLYAGHSAHAGTKGMTFGLYGHDPVLGVDQLGCSAPGLPNNAPCDPYNGDTSCKVKLAVLCVNVDGSSRPPYQVTNDEFYEGWVEGHYATTLPLSITKLGSAANVDALCAKDFGAGWRWAEFHDGQYVTGMNNTTYYYASPWSSSPWPGSSAQPGGWSQWGFGNVQFLTALQRFWVHINSTNANCVTP
jgi:hypothetical protein